MTKKQLSQSISTEDPMWNDAPDMGPEGLIATIDDHDVLMNALRRNAEKNKELLRNLHPHSEY